MHLVASVSANYFSEPRTTHLRSLKRSGLHTLQSKYEGERISCNFKKIETPAMPVDHEYINFTAGWNWRKLTAAAITLCVCLSNLCFAQQKVSGTVTGIGN